jgi:hypothetical protein
MGCDSRRIIGRVIDRRFVADTWPNASSRWRRFTLLPLLVGIFLLIGVQSQQTRAQDAIPITGDRLSGFVLPIEPVTGDITINALKAWTWTVDDTKRMLLDGDVRITVGPYNFMSSDAVVWLNRIPSAKGVINQIAIYFRHVSDPTKAAGLGVDGDKVLVTASARGNVSLTVALRNDKTPTRGPILTEAEARLAEYLKRLAASHPALADEPQEFLPPAPESFIPVPGGSVKPQDVELPTEITPPPTVGSAQWLASPTGTVRFSANKTDIVTGKDENTIIIIGSIIVEYVSIDPEANLTQLSLSAERGVIFTDPATIEGMAAGQLKAASVRGIYLEGNVNAIANSGQYTVRAPQVYYDFRTNQAIMLRSLLRTYPRSEKLPVYARAEEMRQIAANQWQADKSVVSTSEFFTPHFALGADHATVTERPTAADPAETETYIESRGNALQVEGIPVLPLPPFAGTVDRVPLKRVTLGTQKYDGLAIETTWDLFALVAADSPEGLEADLEIDGFTERGPAGGLVMRYDVAEAQGMLDLYGMYDTLDNPDRTSAGRDVQPDNHWRGVALGEYQMELGQYWSTQLQGSYISDPTFISARREEDFVERREYETAAYLKHQRENAAFDVLAKYEVNDFLSNDYLIASRGYTVNKVPELTYRRYGDSLFGDLISYSMENRLSRMQFAFQNTTENQIGVRNGTFPFGPNQNIQDEFIAAGFPTRYVGRFDTRHELTMPLHWEQFNIMPFVVGRFTGYDDDFSSFSSDADDLRFFGAAGVRMSTQYAHIDNSAENQLLDIHRLRHIIEPYVTLWYAHSTVDGADLPIYDQSVEPLSQGGAVEAGFLNTWQTYRGGPGQWTSVDVFTLDTAVVFTSTGEQGSPTPQFFDYRPEYSQFGNHVRARGIWLFSDSLAFVGEGIYDLDESVVSRGSVGAELRHTPLLTTYIQYRFIDISMSELLELGWRYQLTPKYQVAFAPQWDFRADDLRSLNLRITRTFPDFDFTLAVNYDQIRDDTSVGASLNIAEF